MKFKRQGDARQFEIESAPSGSAREGADNPSRLMRLTIDGREVAVAVAPVADGSAILDIRGRRVRVAAARRRSSIIVCAGPLTAEFAAVEGRAGARGSGLAAPEIDAPMPGKVLKILVSEGQSVAHGEALIVLEAMKMETTLFAESPAVVARICVAAGQMVDHGTRLIELKPALVPATPPESPTQVG
jgi:acetyl/propionyl-CoA carboxylase alpha subunit